MASDWKPGRLRDIADVVMGQSPTADYVNEACQGKPLLNGPTEFGSMNPTPVQFTTDVRKKANPGDLLFCVRGSTTGRMNWADQEYAIGRGLAAIRHRDGDAFQHFVRAVIELKLPELLAAATGSTFPNVGRDQLLDITASIPTKNEQQAISRFFKGIDDKIEINRRINQTLETMAEAIFKSWFVDFDPVKAKIAATQEGRDPLRAAMSAISGKPEVELDTLPPEQYEQIAATAALFPNEMEDSELGEIPKGWMVFDMRSLAEVISKGTTPNKSDLANAKDVPIVPFIKVKDISEDGEIARGNLELIARSIHESSLKRSILKTDDLLFSIAGTIGRTAFVDKDLNGANVNQAIAFIRLKDKLSHFSLCWLTLRSIETQNFIASKVVQAVQANASLANIGDIAVRMPGNDVLKKWNSVVSPLILEYRARQGEIRALAILRDTLLPKLMSGDLSVTALAESTGVA